ncbi:MAG: hypothetical protein J6R23_01955 [Spirochaetales bacterium]|nr:hypothetical protein [Spirochaetales bacterium]
MEIFDFDELLSSKAKAKTPSVISIGVFDGVHKGHKHIIERLIKMKDKHPGSEAMVITFGINPKPQSQGALDSVRIRAKYMDQLGVNSFVVIDFSDNFSRITACGFIKLLLELTTPEAIVVGEDFKFGNPSDAASALDLQDLFLKEGRDVEVDIVEQILTEGGEKISSTLLRRLIKNGELKYFFELSGQSFQIDLMPIPYRFDDGKLVFSTDAIHQLLPPLGAYDTDLILSDGRVLKTVANLEKEFLCLDAHSLLSVFGCQNELEKAKVQIDSLSFGEKR